ncbi:protein kinase family protein [Embleya scabrispora]|uniref:protein kinase family protein n=1 Tax=Embleya scabrispora TaxID=159449 RepID=UPI000371CC95|nr:protein kinase family protein [Embleya scabrispora]MYS79814.1 serine/threonine protein kinase [Streptomyces sp. SID5474]
MTGDAANNGSANGDSAAEIADAAPTRVPATEVVPAEPASAEDASTESASAEDEPVTHKRAKRTKPAEATARPGTASEPEPAAPEAAAVEPVEPTPAAEPAPPRVNRGTRLADRYRLEHRLSQNGRSETWRAVDEKLRRAVGVHIVPAGGEHGRAVIAAARAAALMGDPRFVQVLDCAEQDGLIYVVKEWLPDADNLTKVFESAPLPPHEVYELSRAVAQAMSVAHRAGLSHLRLTPENVLRMHTGQYKIVGLAVEAALYGHDSTDAARDDTHAVGRLMYAALTRRWVEGTEYGLQAAPFTGGKLCAPGQIRAGVDDTLAALAMRALGHEVKHEPAFGTPGELSAAIGAIPEIHPPEQGEFVGGPEQDEYPVYTPTPTRTVYTSTGYTGGGSNGSVRPPVVPPPLGGRFGATVKGTVAVLVVLAIVLVTWQVASHVGDGEEKEGPLTRQGDGKSPSAAPSTVAPTPVSKPPIGGKEISIGGGSPIQPEAVKSTFDRNPSTYWRTNYMIDGPEITYNRKGYGIVYDLGEVRELRSAVITLGAGGPHTDIKLMAAPDAKSMPTSEGAFKVKVGENTTNGTELKVDAVGKPVRAQYVLLVMTAMPKVDSSIGDYQIYNAGYQNAWREVTFTTLD